MPGAFNYHICKDFPIKYIRMDNTGENQAINKLCKWRGVKVACFPPNIRKLKNMVEHSFAFRWEIVIILMQNITLKAIKPAMSLHD